MSLPEVKLVLARAEARFARQQLAATRGAYLASSAKWKESAANDLNAFMLELLHVADPASIETPKRVGRGDLAAVFRQFGVPSS